MFTTDYESILEKVESINPVGYCKSRNFLDGDVTYLSPYISRGVISTKTVFESVKKRGFDLKSIEKFIQELAWRDYWQQIWIAKGDLIDSDLKNTQIKVTNHEISKALVNANLEIDALDKCITEFYKTGYLHNHVRMYLASIACNVARSHWSKPAKWMYYHLLDADWASNALSWQWVAGANSNKKYIANQENINKYCDSKQRGTFLDTSYAELEQIEVPGILEETIDLKLETSLPETEDIQLENDKPTLLYNFYNLDPLWKKEEEVNRVLLLEPSHFKKYPVASNTIDFILDLSKNIKGIKVVTAEFSDLQKTNPGTDFYYKEHPTNRHYQGIEEPRDWMFKTTGYYSSFFSFWKKCKKEIKYG